MEVEAALSPGPGPGAQGLKPSTWSLNAPYVPLHSVRQGLVKPGHLGCLHSGWWACHLLVNVLGVGSTTALSLVAWTVSQGCPDPQGHLAGEAEGWVQAGLGSEQVFGPQLIGAPLGSSW